MPSVQSLTLVEVFVIVIALLGLLGIGTDLVELPRSIGDLLWVVALGIAVGSYDRTRSFWIPVLSITVFSLTISSGVYLEAVYGLAAGP